MLHVACFLFFAVDSRTDSKLEMQMLSMCHLVGYSQQVTADLANHLDLLNLLPQGNRPDGIHDPCTWNWVECTYGIVRTIRWDTSRTILIPHSQKIHITWLPSSVEEFIFTGQGKRSRLDTRLLPSELLMISVSQNQFYGSLDISNLPRKLTNADFRFNDFRRVVYLENIPPSLITLYADSNAFSAVVVDNSPLSKRDSTFVFGREYGDESIIEVYERNGETPDARVEVRQW